MYCLFNLNPIMKKPIHHNNSSTIKKTWGQPWIAVISINSGADPSINEGAFTPNHTHFIHSGNPFAINTTQFANYVS